MSLSTNKPVSTAETTVFPQEFWGATQHEFIGAAADRLLKLEVKEKIAQLLQPLGQSMLEEIATWADQIKGDISGQQDPETREFLKDFPNGVHKSWHFVDLPLQVSGYDRAKYPQFTENHDVVQMINESVRVLQGNSKIMSSVNALRWLVHPVGDLHQPLHVASSYIDHETAEMLFDPEVIIERGSTVKSDRGGNDPLLPIGNNITLHSYWDSKIPDHVPAALVLAPEGSDANGGVPPLDKGVELLLEHIDAHNITNMAALAGRPDEWAATWALDAIMASRKAYQTLKITEHEGRKFKVSWEGKNQYDARCAPLVAAQMALAAQRLALLINTLFA